MIPPVIPGRRFTVLLVDDAEDCMAMLDMALRSLPGVTLRSTRSAEDALKVLAAGGISALITDIQLPAMTGLELIARIRKEPGFGAMPILVVSAAADPAMPRVALSSGANAFFPKPFSPAALRRKLEELMYA